MIEAIRRRVPSWFEQAVLFAVVGGLGFAVDAGVLLLLTKLGVSALLGRAISLSVTVVFTWQLNRRLTFQLTTPPTFREFAHYVTISLVSILINYSVYTALVLLNAPVLLAAAVGTVVAAVFNFIRYRALLSKQRP